MPLPSMLTRLPWAVLCALGLALLAWDIGQRPPREGDASASAAQAPSPLDAAPSPLGAAPAAASLQRSGAGTIPMPPHTPAAHASSLLAMPAGHPAALTAFWFAGTGESAPDVQIAAAQFDRAQQRWSEAQIVVSRQALGEGLGFGVRRLGNPVAWLDGQGRMHLWVVATGAGGWAASRIAHLRQVSTQPAAQGTGEMPGALRFRVERVLPLSWFWNTSYLVRNAPLALQGGGMLLPVHFELGIKYPVALRFDAQGSFVGMVRMSGRTHLLQPSLLALDGQHWLALMRNQAPNGHIAVVSTHDGGQSWQDAPDLPLTNPNAAVAGLALAPGSIVLAHNTQQYRTRLELSSSQDGRAWQPLQVLAQGGPEAEFSYPALAWADGSLWVSYTDRRQRIAWQRFSVANTASAVPAKP